MSETKIDKAIKSVGIDLLRELRAISWFCDTADDGKMALIPSNRRHWYHPGGHHHPLVETGCVTLIQKTRCSTIRAYRPAIRMQQFGRQVLVRARALRLPIEIDDAREATP